MISIPFDYHFKPSRPASGSAYYALNLPLDAQKTSHYDGEYDFNEFHRLFTNIWSLFCTLDGYSIFFRRVSARAGIHLDSPESVVFHLDHTRHPPAELEGLEVEAAKHGIVYLKLAGEGRIGTLVNGAGLAMNTCDTISARGGSPANFLDTGGKATGRTVVESLRTVLSDTRVPMLIHPTGKHVLNIF